MTAPVTYGPDRPLVIVALERTCDVSPSQWHGTTEHYAHAYIRYRFGRFSVDLIIHHDEGVPENMERWTSVLEEQDDDRWAGYLSDDDLRARVPEWIVLPEEIG